MKNEWKWKYWRYDGAKKEPSTFFFYTYLSYPETTTMQKQQNAQFNFSTLGKMLKKTTKVKDMILLFIFFTNINKS